MKKSVFVLNEIHDIAPAVEARLLSLSDTIYSISTKEWDFIAKDGVGTTRFNDVKTSHHAFGRWNERIGPFATYDQLANLIKYICMYEPSRVEMYNAKQLNGTKFQYFILDKDIVAIFTIENDVLVIQTYLGRLSLKPQLQSVAELYDFIVTERDNTDLNVPTEVLQLQHLPYGPFQSMQVADSLMYYQMEFSNEKVVLKVDQDPNSTSYTYTIVLLKHRHNMNLDVLDLSTILKMSNRKFVAKYISTNYKEMPDLCEHYSNKSLFNFKQKVLYNRGEY
ncbi:hypothetical protein [Solibacillus isronensis]|uniref:hypothetical protein n=1 Tax=Solibacillus isronensis TaxID=412383 RepID=UPI0039A334A1